MSLKDVEIKVSYESKEDDLVDEFYIPVLKQAKKYDRIAGFFSSTCLAISARGITGLINNGGKIRLLVSPRLNENDIKAIDEAYDTPENILARNLINEIDDIEDLLIKKCTDALGWLIAKGLLEIKVAIVVDDKGRYKSYATSEKEGLFHQKVGIIYDSDDNYLSFSGSINETASGWINNIEEFKVFKGWQSGQDDYCQSDINKFDAFWQNERKNVKVLSLPEAVKNHLVEHAPSDIREILDCYKYLESINNVDKYKALRLFDYQDEAVQLWLKNDKRLVCEMATGTGKTRTAIGCMVKALEANEKLVVFVVCPQNPLSLQWKRDIDELEIGFETSIIVDGTNRKWRLQLEEKLLDISIGLKNSLIVYTTHKTFSSKDFINIIKDNKYASKYMIVGDEAHGLGAYNSSKGLVDEYDFRLALSATPKRWYDDSGTQRLYNFFGEEIFEFDIKKALNTKNPITKKTYLTNYYYYPVFVTLSDDEIEEYEKLTKKIIKLLNSKSKDAESSGAYENYLFKRADIHKSAVSKYECLENILYKIDDIKDLIIFVSSEQIDKVIKICSERGIRVHRFTQNEGNNPKGEYQGRTERQYIIDNFKEGIYQSLVAIKCLDEGIDIPSASKAILLASSTNPREYVQRIGRVIRRHQDKDVAIIYDVIVKPDYKRLHENFIKIEKKIFENELKRTIEIAENALNNSSATKIVFDVMKEGY